MDNVGSWKISLLKKWHWLGTQKKSNTQWLSGSVYLSMVLSNLLPVMGRSPDVYDVYELRSHPGCFLNQPKEIFRTIPAPRLNSMPHCSIKLIRVCNIIRGIPTIRHGSINWCDGNVNPKLIASATISYNPHFRLKRRQKGVIGQEQNTQKRLRHFEHQDIITLKRS